MGQLIIGSMFKLFSKIFFELSKLSFVGVLIGFYHSYDFIISIILSVGCLGVFIKILLQKSAQKWVYIVGMFLSAIMGILVEIWGIENNHWKYHDLDAGRTFPYWLPFAWMFAFIFIYRLERTVITIQRVDSLKTKFLIVLLISTFFPAVGEMITIYLNVWTYYWPNKVLGVPLYALLLLPAFHMGVSTLLIIICQKFNIQDPVFSISKNNS